jgi:hypothetical protein
VLCLWRKVTSRLRFEILVTAAVLLVSCSGSKTETDSASAGSVGITQDMARIVATPHFYIDGIGTTMNPRPDSEIVVSAAGPLSVAGWVAELGGSPPAGVGIVIDQKTFAATYGIERLDVAAALKNPSYNKSGFIGSIPASQLSSGPHTLTVRIINGARNGYFETPSFHIRVQ